MKKRNSVVAVCLAISAYGSCIQGSQSLEEAATNAKWQLAWTELLVRRAFQKSESLSELLVKKESNGQLSLADLRTYRSSLEQVQRALRGSQNALEGAQNITRPQQRGVEL
jgi:hypothetical protein